MTTPVYQIGGSKEFTAEFRDKDNALAEPTTAVLEIREPDGVLATPAVTPGTIGIRNAVYTFAKPGRHLAMWIGTGVVAAEPFEFHVLRKETSP